MYVVQLTVYYEITIPPNIHAMIQKFFGLLYIYGKVWRCNTDRNICTSLPLHRLITTTATWRDYHQLIPCSLTECIIWGRLRKGSCLILENFSDVSNTQFLHQNTFNIELLIYVGYSESKYRLRISLAHPRDCHFAHVQGLHLSIEKSQMSFCVMFMFVPVR